MGDYTKCDGDKCPLRHSCKRAKNIEVSNYESYFLKPPFKYNKGKFECDMFWGDAAELLLAQLKSIFQSQKG